MAVTQKEASTHWRKAGVMTKLVINNH